MDDSDWRRLDLAAPTPEHALLAGTLAEFVAREVEPQAARHDREERFNHALFLRAGELGLLGVTIPEEYGGAGLDATALHLGPGLRPGRAGPRRALRAERERQRR
jgi:isovaleryl-CoA dehydrogenase